MTHTKTLQKHSFISFLLALLCLIIVSSRPSVAQENGFGRLTGSVQSSVLNDQGIHDKIIPSENMTIELWHEDDFVSSTETDAKGQYCFEGISEGTFRVVAFTAENHQAEAAVDIASRLTSAVNFIAIEDTEQGIYPSFPATLSGAGFNSPDIDGDGIVALNDLDLLNKYSGTDTEMFPEGDLNGDGKINELDLNQAKEVFGRVVLTSPGLFKVVTTPGSSVADVGNGKYRISSIEGHTLGEIYPGEDHNLAHILVKEDRGLVNSTDLGNIHFRENASDPTWVTINLDTGRVVEGRLTLNLESALFPGSFDLEAQILDGMVAFAPHGLNLYHHVNVRGTVPNDIPFLGGYSFLLSEGPGKKKDVNCASEVVETSDSRCALGGVACKREGAVCSLNGDCERVCRTIVLKRKCRRCMCLRK